MPRSEGSIPLTLPPVMPDCDVLPLASLSWERFEAFCQDLVSCLPNVIRDSCHRYGNRGSRQRGIDIFADLEDGTRWAFQCKQRRRFTSGDAERTIKEATYSADRYIILVSCEVGAAVRDVCERHRGWDVWDIRDLSRMVRELKKEHARRIVQTHFGTQWLKPFLAISSLTAFLPSEEFFRPLLDPTRLFNHAWSLVGRAPFLTQLRAFMCSEQYKVAILTGRGGIGKTKLLHAIADDFKGMNLFFAFDGVTITPESANELPVEDCVLVVDDAHRREDLPTLFALVQQRTHRTKLILSTRPLGIAHLQTLLNQAGFDPHEIMRCDELKELTRDEVKKLAQQALGRKHVHLADQLASVTWDCPLVTVVGGRLLAERAISPYLLERNEEFRYAVLSRFHQTILGQVDERVDPNLCKGLLELISAIGPVRMRNERFQQAMAEFLGVERPELITALGSLEQAGILLRRGRTLRIIPDVLADHILHEACLTPQGQPTGYAQRVFNQFASICSDQVLRNLAELDWRIRQTDRQGANLLSDIWVTVEEEFRGASHSGRCQILQVLKNVAYFQPERMLALVEHAMRFPATVPEDEKVAPLYRHSHADVLRELPEMLRRIGYTIDYLPQCCDLLWELGRDDERPLNQYPEHAIRILQDLADYDIDKLLIINETVLTAVERWLKAPDVHAHRYSPLNILDRMLVKSGSSFHSEGHQMIYRPFLIRRGPSQKIRDRALELIAGCLASDKPKVVLRAIKSLEDALREPMGLFGQQITDEDRAQWIPEQLRVLAILQDLVARTAFPLVHLRVMDALRWQSCHGPSGVVKEKAQEVITSVLDYYELRLTRALIYSHDWDWLPEDEDAHAAYRRHEEAMRAQRRAVALEFMQRNPAPAKGAHVLGEMVENIKNCGFELQPWFFLRELGEANPAYAAAVCEAIIDGPCAIAPYLGSLLSPVRTMDRDRAIAIADRAVATGDVIFYRSVADYWGIACADDPQPQDLEILTKLLAKTDTSVKKAAIISLGRLGASHPGLAISLVLQVDVGDSRDVAREVCMVIDEKFGFPPDALSDTDLSIILKKLESVSDIDDYYISEFIAYACKRVPRLVVQLLLNRIFRSEEMDDGRYTAMPYGGFHHQLEGLAKSGEYEDILREIRNHATMRTWQVQFWLAKLFKEVSLGFSGTSLKVLSEWISSGEVNKIEAVSNLLQDAPPQFVFKEIDFVVNILNEAYVAGCYDYVIGNLFSSAISGVRTGTPGQPMPQDITLKNQASVAAKRFLPGSPAHRFYESLRKHAEESIAEHLARNEEMFE